jgi:hypothetical protein
VVQINGTVLENCTKPEQYKLFKNLTKKLDDASAFSYMKVIGCVMRCKFTKYQINKIYDSNFDYLNYTTGTTDGSNIDVSPF